MSIRKRSETIYLQERQANRTKRPWRIAEWLLVGCVALGVLIGCSRGTASDAERGRAIDAQQTSVVSDLQATESAKLLLESSPEASPTATP